jgi:hypothetical protein
MWKPSDDWSRVIRRNQRGLEHSGAFVHLVTGRRYIRRDYLVSFYAHWRNRYRITSKLVPTCADAGEICSTLV